MALQRMKLCLCYKKKGSNDEISAQSMMDEGRGWMTNSSKTVLYSDLSTFDFKTPLQHKCCWSFSLKFIVNILSQITSVTITNFTRRASLRDAEWWLSHYSLHPPPQKKLNAPKKLKKGALIINIFQVFETQPLQTPWDRIRGKLSREQFIGTKNLIICTKFKINLNWFFRPSYLIN